ncbi:MAG: glycoside hydrolase family 3 N-terminal domain-containing protein [Coriobacteriaceae bacterium]|nr:glycoside hydrolase family 3 N-terminal domain-containing protein [Coriobacteriaceae bacterium]
MPEQHVARQHALLDYEEEHMARVRAGLAECMVLLRKDGGFPLEGPCKLAAYGNGVRHSVKGGTGSGDVNAHVVVNVEQGLRNAGFELVGDWWLDEYDARRAKAKKAFYRQLRREAKAAGKNVVFYSLGAIMPEPEYSIPMDFSADAAIYVLSRVAGEGADRKVIPGDVLLTQTEIRDILLLNERYERFMLVLNVGAPVDLSPVQEVGNILVLSQLGSQMGDALADVLLGRANPSGKLATTWSATGNYCPDIEIGDPDDTRYREGIYVGYRYFDTVGKRAMYPFGFGLSFTEFELAGVRAALDGPAMTLRASVRNVGTMAGKQVVQAYVTAPEGALKKPWQELAGFAKTGLLQPGESEEVAVSFDFADLASFDQVTSAYVLEAGDYAVRLGTSSADAAPVAVVELARDVTLRTVRPVAGHAGFADREYERAARTEDLAGVPRLQLDPACLKLPAPVYDAEPDVDPAVAALSDEELAYLAVGQFSGKGGMLSLIGDAAVHVAGAAGESSSRLAGKGFAPLVMADGPAGLRLSRDFYRDATGPHSLGNGSIPEGVLDVLSAPVRLFLRVHSRSGKLPKGATLEHQYCTALPVGTAIAQSWNVEYAQACGDIVGAEMERFGVHLWLAPSMNIHRSILCGRNFEYFSEDPLVTGKMAAALVRGVQAHSGRAACVKHFAANNQETNRYFNNSQVSERALREVYLKGFGICVREGRPLAVMTSYNLVNGVHTSESRPLIEDYLRAECGFAGVVITDWVIANFNSSDRHPAAQARRVAAAGGDLFMPGSQSDYDDILAAMRSGELPRHQVEVNATRVARLSRMLNG